MKFTRLVPLVAVFGLVAASSPSSVVAAARPAPLGSVPGTSCAVFPADNVWNMDISRLPVHRKSVTWKKAMHSGGTDLHPDFGPPSYGIPFDVVDAAHVDVAVDFTYDDESDPGPYPFGPDITIEGGSGSSGDRHAIMVDQDTCTLYELFAARWNGGDPSAGSGAVFDLDSNGLRPAGWTSADAAGLPIFPGLVRYDEVEAGAIEHAIRVTADCTSRSYLWPARHQAGSSDRRCPPMGARFRLRSSFGTAGYSDEAKVVIRAFKRYGMIVADNGSDWYFQGTVDDRWTNDLMDELKSIPASRFVAVDESKCKVASGSGAFEYGPKCPAPTT
ncbi:MAG TPA: hypothetical protein VI341_10690 [Actinomycetota bacterium]